MKINREILQYSVLKLLLEDECKNNRTSDYSKFYEWTLEYYKNKLIDRDRLVAMIAKRREIIDEELSSLDFILGAKVTK